MFLQRSSVWKPTRHLHSTSLGEVFHLDVIKATLVERGNRSRDNVVPTQKWESRRPFAGATTGEQFVRCPLIAQMLKDSVVLSHQRVRKHQMAPIQNQTVVVVVQEQKEERPEARSVRTCASVVSRRNRYTEL